DELGDRIGVVVDGVDGRVHHVALSEAARAEPPAVGSIVQVGSASTGSRRSDHNIAELADDTGVYRPSAHRALVESGTIRVPGGDS
ncbi:DUF3363 domain-containing protein, partial [Acinetobacter baumannii]